MSDGGADGKRAAHEGEHVNARAAVKTKACRRCGLRQSLEAGPAQCSSAVHVMFHSAYRPGPTVRRQKVTGPQGSTDGIGRR